MNLFDENINCFKLHGDKKDKLKTVVAQAKPFERTFSDESDKGWLDPLNLPVDESPYRNIFQTMPVGVESPTAGIKSFSHKHKPSLKKTNKQTTHVRIKDEAMDIVRYCKVVLRFVMDFVWRCGAFVTIYGTELVIQLIAVTTIAMVMVLKLLDRLVSNQYLEGLISVIENTDFRSLKFPTLHFDYIYIYRISARIIWILWKIFEFVIIVLKHVIIQVFFGCFFLISWALYTIIQFVSRVILFPTIDKTANFLKMDAEAINTITKFQFHRLFLLISLSSNDLTPITTDLVISISNMRYNIVKVNLIKSGLIEIFLSIKSSLKSAMEIVTDLSGFVRLFLDLHGTLLVILILLCNTISTIGMLVYYVFLSLESIGYVLGIFLRVLNSATSALSKLQKI